MNSSSFIALAVLLVFVIVSVYATKVFVGRRDRRLLKQRIEELLPPISLTGTAPGQNDATVFMKQIRTESVLGAIINRYFLSCVSLTLSEFTLLSVACAVISALVCWSLELPPFAIIILSCVAFVLPPLVLRIISANKQKKFVQQLPNAIDLLISVLKSGHSIPQAIKAVAEEIQTPCGTEFNEILQRLNLGQSLPDALAVSANRYQSFELDLIRRATAIQMEVGGSLADLLEKTNQTLRERLKFKRHILVLTSSSRLSAWIVGLMPFVIGTVFYYLNPQYMSPLFETNLGKGLMVLAVVLEIIGILIMKRLCYFKV